MLEFRREFFTLSVSFRTFWCCCWREDFSYRMVWVCLVSYYSKLERISRYLASCVLTVYISWRFLAFSLSLSSICAWKPSNLLVTSLTLCLNSRFSTFPASTSSLSPFPLLLSSSSALCSSLLSFPSFPSPPPPAPSSSSPPPPPRAYPFP
jgi:hypothetical protein